MATTIKRASRKRASGSTAVAELKSTVDSLIRENRTLKRQLTKLEAAGATSRPGRRANAIAKGVSALARKVERALAASQSGTRRRSSRSAGTRRTTAAKKARTTQPRKVASPETRAKRLAALARAREARAAKKAAAKSAS
jgi:hypothetical protein